MASRTQNTGFQIVLFTLLCTSLLAVNGYFFPLALMPDSYGYLGISENITDIWGAGGSVSDVNQKFRILGYPVIIAALEQAFGSRPFLPVYVLHAVLVVVTGAILFWTLLRLGVASLAAALLSLLYIAALPTMLASFLLTDTIANSLTAIAICLMAEPLFKPGHPALVRVAVAGLLMGVAFFMREANQYLIVCLLPMVLTIAWTRRKLLFGIGLACLLMGPVLLASEAYKSFNEARYDQRFVTVGGRTVMLHALLPLAQRKPALFEGSTDLDKVSRETLQEYTFAETMKINNTLLGRGYSEERLAKVAFDKYFEAWRRYPLAMVRVVLERMRFDKQATELLNPVLGFYNNARWRSKGALVSESIRMRAAMRRGDAKEFLAVLPVTAGRIPSLIVFVFVILGSPVVIVRAWARNDFTLALGLSALLASYLGYVLVYALVNMEMRYLSGIAVILPLSAALAFRYTPLWVRTADQEQI